MSNKLRFMSFVAAACLLSACASMIDRPNQDVQIVTPGAVDSKCLLRADDAKYTAHPPETLFVRRSPEPLTVTCQAPGNREKTIVVYAKMNKTATADVATAGVGAAYDHFSGALYAYPNLISVDFRNTVAKGEPLPAYHAADTLSPFDPSPEDMQGGAPAVSKTDALPTAPAIDSPY